MWIRISYVCIMYYEQFLGAKCTHDVLGMMFFLTKLKTFYVFCSIKKIIFNGGGEWSRKYTSLISESNYSNKITCIYVIITIIKSNKLPCNMNISLLD